MLLAFLAGCGLALGHHFFYASLRGQHVPTGSYTFAGTKLHKQRFNTSVGTAFAFLIKTFLAVAISIAYVQLFWCAVKKMKQKPSLGELDWADAGLTNVLSLFYLKLWWKYPLLAVLALIFWCMPIATVFTPATLSTERAFEPRHEMHKVPQFDFVTMNYVSALESDGGSETIRDWAWTGPSQPVQHIALSVMGLGDILQIPSPWANASWSLNFWGPALRCDNVVDTKRDSIWKNIWNSYNGTDASYVYLSWVPWSDTEGSTYYLNFRGDGIDPDLPFLFGSDFETGNGGPYGPSRASLSTKGPATIFVAVIPAPQNLTFSLGEAKWSSRAESCAFKVVQSLREPLTECGPNSMIFTPSLVFEDATLLRCELINTSYVVDFKYPNGAQHVTVMQNATDKAQVVYASNYFIGPSPPIPPDESNACSPFQVNHIPNATGAPCTLDTGAARLLSYQGIMAAFNQMILGTVTNPGFYSDGAYLNSTVTRTILGQTEELGILRTLNEPLMSGSDYKPTS